MKGGKAVRHSIKFAGACAQQLRGQRLQAGYRAASNNAACRIG